MNINSLTQILTILLVVMIFILMILSIIFLVLKSKENKKKNTKEISKEENKNKDKTKLKAGNTEYNKQSIMDFMEFDKVEDNMIIQKDGKRFLMVVECQGVNYDLMSRVEKVAVEEGFQQFLNTLRHPIQIYIQTRTVNLENTISVYKDRVKEVEDKYRNMTLRYNQMRESEAYSKEDMDKYYFEITKQRNLLEYGKDIIANTEKMSLNKNVLNKKYYIIIPYFSEESTDEKYAKDEISSMAFSELYGKAQAIIRALASCSVGGKILTSKELVDLLYVAYNRDEAERFGIEKAMLAGYDELYSTSQDVFEKKIKVLDEEIKDKAIDLANETIMKVKSRPQKIADDKQSKFEELVKKMAEVVINDNKEYLGQDVAESAIEELEKMVEEGGKEENEKEKRTTRTRKTNKQ
jgi:hypothetical protein cdiviTM7_00582